MKPSFTLESQKRLDVICVLDFGADLLNNDADKRLVAFNNQTSVLNVYKFEDALEAEVRFSGESTDKEVLEFFELEKNASHVLFKKRMNLSDLFTEDFLKARFNQMERSFFKFGIEIFNKYELNC